MHQIQCIVMGRGTVAFKPPEVVIFTLTSQVGVSKIQRGDVTCPQLLRDHPSGPARGAIPRGAGRVSMDSLVPWARARILSER